MTNRPQAPARTADTRNVRSIAIRGAVAVAAIAISVGPQAVGAYARGGHSKHGRRAAHSRRFAGVAGTAPTPGHAPTPAPDHSASGTEHNGPSDAAETSAKTDKGGPKTGKGGQHPDQQSGHGPGNPVSGPQLGSGHKPAQLPTNDGKVPGSPTGTQDPADHALVVGGIPVLGHRVSLVPASPQPGSRPAGPVLVRVAGSKTIEPLTAASSLPVGSHVDARNSAVTITSAVSTDGTVQAATFWGGVFEIRQDPGGRGYTRIVPLGGHFRTGCGSSSASSGKAASAAAYRSHGKVLRWLWSADNHGRYRTHGRNSVATVRGTAWVTVETCTGTITYVLAGEVAVHDLHLHKTVLVKAGHEYFARSA